MGKLAHVVLSYDSGDAYLHQAWDRVFGKVSFISWKQPIIGVSDDQNHVTLCNITTTWEAMFWDMAAHRDSTPLREWPIPAPVHAVRHMAQTSKDTFIQEHNCSTLITVHGRSFEFNPAFCVSSGHAPYKCSEGFCDHGYQTTLARFRSFLPVTTTAENFLMLSDGQNVEYAQGYRHYELGGDLFLQMWKMVISDIHVAHPGSSVDYVVWRWREDNGYISNSTFMLPWTCYNQGSHLPDITANKTFP